MCGTLGVVSVQQEQYQPPFLLGKGSALPNLDDEAELSGEVSLEHACVSAGPLVYASLNY